jgi:hypothetical protein
MQLRWPCRWRSGARRLAFERTRRLIGRRLLACKPEFRRALSAARQQYLVSERGRGGWQAHGDRGVACRLQRRLQA